MADEKVVEEENRCMVISKLSAPVLRRFEPVGRWYESRARHVRLLSGGGSSVGGTEGENGEEDEEGGGMDFSDEVNPLLLDPTQWKDQDHYVLLGLGKLRWQATEQEIRKAYRQKVLVHHPDKKQQSQGEGEEDSHFKCIKIAYDILSSTKRRRAFDSVDPTFDDVIPPNNAHSRDNFFQVFEPAFRENERWSVKQPVPKLGTEESTFEQVNMFYSFWYDIESWREFSYMDEENLEKAENRDERRWMEKQNKATRQKRKKEEVARIRSLVDTAYTLDPRIKKFKEAEKLKKEAKKRARAEAARLEAEERERAEQRKLAEERERREKEELESRAQAAQAKKEKEAAKKVLKRERKLFRSLCKTNNYYFIDGGGGGGVGGGGRGGGGGEEGEVPAGRLQELEALCESLTVDQLQSLNTKMKNGGIEEGKMAVEEALLRKRQKEEAELAAQARVSQAGAQGGGGGGGGGGGKEMTDKDWTREEVQLLVKAVALYPSGTSKRWEVIATFVNDHSKEGSKPKTPKQVISKVKTLKKLEATQRDSENSQAFQAFQETVSTKATATVEAAPTERYDKVPWTTDEQKLLEKALRSYPASTPERWEKISAMVASRSKTECVARCKELVARVKAKKQSS